MRNTQLTKEEKRRERNSLVLVVAILIVVAIVAIWFNRRFYNNEYRKMNDYEKDLVNQAEQDDQRIPETNPYFNQ